MHIIDLKHCLGVYESLYNLSRVHSCDISYQDFCEMESDCAAVIWILS